MTTEHDRAAPLSFLHPRAPSRAPLLRRDGRSVASPRAST